MALPTVHALMHRVMHVPSCLPLQMEKTEKTMAEMEIERNLTFEFDRITEAGSELKPLSGPGYVGLTNLGNSCYMNSVVQVGGGRWGEAVCACVRLAV